MFYINLVQCLSQNNPITGEFSFISFILLAHPWPNKAYQRPIVKNSLYLQFWKSASLLTNVIAISWALAQHKGCAAEYVDSAPVAQLISVCCCAAVTAQTRRHSIAAPLGRAFEVMFGCSVLLLIVCLRECGCCWRGCATTMWALHLLCSCVCFCELSAMPSIDKEAGGDSCESDGSLTWEDFFGELSYQWILDFVFVPRAQGVIKVHKKYLIAVT